MSLTLWLHPLSSFSWKALIALYENGAAFTPKIVGPETAADFKALWPIGKFPVLVDHGAGDHLAPESSILIEYLDTKFPGAVRLIPADGDLSRQARMKDRFYDHYVHHPMQKIVADRLRAKGERDPRGVADARAQIEVAYGVAERDMSGKTWAMGEDFSIADCSAAPALFYGDRVAPLAGHPNLAAYLERLKGRPSFARVLREAEPYFKYYPADYPD